MATEISTNTAPARGLALATMDDAWRFAKMVAASEFAPKDFRGKPESCLLAIQHGAEPGLGPMQSLQSIAVINGRPSIWGDAALALVMASPVCEYVKETIEGEYENAVATCIAKRKGYPEPVKVQFSMADAKRAGLAGKTGPWSQYPKRMLQLRARGFALRDAFPDVLKGLVTAEEAQDYPTATPLTNSVKAVTEPAPGLTVAHVESFTPPAASEADMAKARKAIGQTTDLAKLADFSAKVTERFEAGFYLLEQADELRNLIDTRLETLNAQPVEA